ncbi:uncharacterized protein LOC126837662, partial [Adelges cooleyi]|uniref:uncharacterized protein LOC126837662 n=1 Tax=Adelges cooleyi TaxID=133065 RepID=UPI00218081BE
MKLFCVVILFVFVNVSADDRMLYTDMVRRTNEVIERAYHINDLTVNGISGINGLEYVIEAIVDDKDYNGNFGKINVMIAVPDILEIVVHLTVPRRKFPNALRKAMHFQDLMQIEVINKLRQQVWFGFLMNESHDYKILDLTALAEQRRRRVKPALKNIIERTLDISFNQFNMKQPEIRDTSNLGGLNLTTLVEKRRVTGTSLKNTMRRSLETNIPKADDDDDDENEFLSFLSFRLCRLMALYMSTQFPTAYIKDVQTDSNICIMDDGITQKRYKQING